MTWSDILIAQLSDPFRIALIVGLCVMTARLRQNSGVIMPLAAGVLFFAILLPNTLPIATAPVPLQMITGVGANLIILSVIGGAWLLLQRFRR